MVKKSLMLVILIVLAGATYYFVLPYFKEDAEKTKKIKFINNVHSTARNVIYKWKDNYYECNINGVATESSEILHGEYLLVVEDKGMKGYLKMNLDTRINTVALTDGKYNVDALSKNVDDLKVGDVNIGNLNPSTVNGIVCRYVG